MLIEQQKRAERVRFRHPIRVVTLEGEPRVIRTLTANVSKRGLFLRMPEPLPSGTKIALSLEAGGRALALAQAEVMWGRRAAGCGVRFTEFLHPRAKELVEYLVENLDQGKPLTLGKKRPVWRRVPAMVAMFVVIAALPLVWRLASSLSPAGERVGERADPVVVLAPEPAPVNEAAVVAAPRQPELTEQEISEMEKEIADAAAHARVLEEDEALAMEAGDADAEPANPHPDAVARGGEEERVDEALVAVAKAEAAVVSPLPDPVAPNVVAPEGFDPRGGEGERVDEAPVAVAKAEAAVVRPLPRGGEGVRAGSVKLPTGAAQRLAWKLSGSQLRLSPELTGDAHVTRAFVLSGPPRAVFDLSGAAPHKSLTVSASAPFATGVRLGKQGTGTRIVVDLDQAPKRTSQDDGALVLSF